jgi:hypothetical protein
MGLVVALTLTLGLPAVAADGGGTVEIEVRYSGAPVVDTAKVTRDGAVCGTESRVEKVSVGARKGLANVVAGIPDVKAAEAGRRQQIEEKGCQFQPYVTVAAPGEIEFVNADPVVHGLRVHSTVNPPFTRVQTKARRTVERFEKPEIVMLTCDVHPWAVGWLAVVPNTYYAVTDSSGVARIADVPPGRHQVEIWHEVFGRHVKEVDVKGGQTTRVAFEVRR